MNKSEVTYKGEYFYILKETIDGRKTPIYHIINNSMRISIGSIKWFAPWRKYCFYPSTGTVWDNKCLQQILDLLNEYNKK